MAVEIHYIWINKFGHFAGDGINLSSKYFISFHIESEDKHIGTLTIKHNPDYIPNFFEKTNISNVTAIIGKNGTGKSTILSYIKNNLPQGLAANVNDDIIVYTEYDPEENFSERKEMGKILHPTSWKIKIIDETGYFDKTPYNNNLFESTDAFNIVSGLSQATFIYYSFVLDYKTDGSNWQGLKDISTAALLQDEWRERMEFSRTNLDSPNLLGISELESFIGNEIAKAIQLIISEFGSKLPFAKPEYLNISLINSDRIFFNSSNKQNLDVYEMIKRWDNANINFIEADKLVNNFYFGILINFLLTQRKYASTLWFNYDLNFDFSHDIKDIVSNFFKNLSTYTYQSDNGKSIPVEKHILLSKIVPDFISFFDDLIKAKAIIPTVDNSSYFKLKLTNESDELFKQLMVYYLEIKGLTAFLDFRWRNLSTGEQSFLSFMSRFYHLKRHEIGNDQLGKSLVIMIDEGDAGYHPEWQRDFFKNTTDFLSELLSDHELQFIFTANTPFLASDLPKSNIIFIEKIDASTNIIHSHENDRHETFGINIHTLLSNSFYMEGALIGSFAKKKIDTIIKYLGNKRIKVPNAEYKKTIEIIGEPILRRKLMSMWNEKFKLDDELEILLKRIEEIKKSQKRRSTKKSDKNTLNDKGTA